MSIPIRFLRSFIEFQVHNEKHGSRPPKLEGKCDLVIRKNCSPDTCLSLEVQSFANASDMVHGKLAGGRASAAAGKAQLHTCDLPTRAQHHLHGVAHPWPGGCPWLPSQLCLGLDKPPCHPVVHFPHPIREGFPGRYGPVTPWKERSWGVAAFGLRSDLSKLQGLSWALVLLLWVGRPAAAPWAPMHLPRPEEHPELCPCLVPQIKGPQDVFLGHPKRACSPPSPWLPVPSFWLFSPHCHYWYVFLPQSGFFFLFPMRTPAPRAQASPLA